MRFKTLALSGALAATLFSVPAQAATGRIASPVGGESQLEGTSIPYIVGFLVILATGLGIHLSTEDVPTSP